MQIQHSFAFSLLNITTDLKNYAEKLMCEIGLHASQIFVLETLWDNDNLTQSDIAKKLKVSAPTVNKMIKSLQNSGFVSCNRCKFDARASRVKLSKKGREIRPQVYENWQKIEDYLLRDLSDTEKMLLSLQIEKLKKKTV